MNFEVSLNGNLKDFLVVQCMRVNLFAECVAGCFVVEFLDRGES
jgi:hypothetical protein